jgi:hypothetical protein
VLGDVGGEHVGDGLVRADLHGRGNAELAHAWSLPPDRPAAPSPQVPAQELLRRI